MAETGKATTGEEHSLSESQARSPTPETHRGPARDRLTTVRVPEPFREIFLNAQEYVARYFQGKEEVPEQGLIEVSGERYILVRAASMSKEFFDLVSSLYHDRGEREARTVAFGFLFDIAHAIGKADAKSFFAKMGVREPIERLSAGPIHFAHTGWAYVDIFPESHPTPDDDYYLIYDHPFSFEADTWMKTGKRTDFPVCAMNAGYSSGWCEESFGVGLVAAEVECRAKGDEHCRFIMAPPSRIKDYIDGYENHSGARGSSFGTVDVPEFFQRKRLEDELLRDITERRKAEEELRRHKDLLEDLVEERTTALRKTVEQLQTEITEREQAELALKKSETMLRAIFDQTFQFIGILKLTGIVVKVNKTAMDFVRTTEQEILGKPFWETPWWPGSRKDRDLLRQAIERAARGELVRFETVHRGPDGRETDFDFSLKPVKDETGRTVLLIAEGRDIAALKAAMEDLRKREKQLKTQSRNLEEANIALKVVLKKMEEKKREDKETILANVKQLVIPYLHRLKQGRQSAGQQVLLETLESNLYDITSGLVSRLSSSFLNLTPMEIRVAHLIKEGLTNKEIAELLGTSLNTVSSHRYKIRTKLRLKNQGKNLRSYLLSLENSDFSSPFSHRISRLDPDRHAKLHRT